MECVPSSTSTFVGTFTTSSSSTQPTQTSHNSQDASRELLHDTFNMHQVFHWDLDSNREELNDFNDVGETHNRLSKEQPSTEAVKFYQLFEVLTRERL